MITIRMKRIQVKIDGSLLLELDNAAKEKGTSRSALVKRALHDCLPSPCIREPEARDRIGYAKFPDDPHDAALWERAAVWPDD
jgi:metal-responsive CopG/Arc/MetJ family transcriptional regulator